MAFRGTGAQPGSGRWLDLRGLSEIEDLGALAVQALHISVADTALGLVDVDLDMLSVIPEPVVEAFAELKNIETEVTGDASAGQKPQLDELAQCWGKREDVEIPASEAVALVNRISELVSMVVAEDEDARLALYYLSA